MSANFPPVGSHREGGPGGGLALRSSPSAILQACEGLGPVFVLYRSDACIFGAVANPLWFLSAANVHLAASGALTLNLAPSRACSIYNYVEHGPAGGVIDAIEFTTRRRVGFLKLCRMDETRRDRWMSMLAEFRIGGVDRECIAGIRKSNHLTGLPETGGGASPAESVLLRFLDHAVEARALLHVTAQTAAARSRLALQPTHHVRVGNWIVASADTTALHLAVTEIVELRVVLRPHVALLVLLGAGGSLIARILTRDRELMKRLPSIL